MTIRAKKLFMLLLCMLLLPTFGLAIEIVYPADKSYVLQSDYLIIRCGVEPVVDMVTVELGGVKSDPFDISSPDYRAIWGDMLILAPDFDPGANRVIVETFTDGVVSGRAEVELFYVDGDKYLSAPANFKPFVMHRSEQEEPCRQCHNMTPSKAELAIQGVENHPCASCHERMLDTEYVHGPAGVFQCGYCHLADSQPDKYLLRGTEMEICSECHSDMIDGFTQKKFIHGPVSAGLCSACHDAHGSEHRSQLSASVNDLCFSCHEKIQTDIHVVRGVGGKGHPLSGVPDPSSPDQMISCVSCHDPHAGQSNAYFRDEITSRFSLCNVCHNR